MEEQNACLLFSDIVTDTEQLRARTCKLAMVWYHQKSREVMK